MAARVVTAEPWSSSIGKASWRALAASWLGWMFDGYESYALVLVMTPAVRQLLSPERLPNASIYAGGLLAVTLLGWAVGGVAAGVLADYLGRRRTLMLSILCYAVFAGLAALSWNYWSLLTFRFLTGLGLGAEWGPGAAIVAEFWPPASRGRAAGALHAAYGVGLLLASGIWLLLRSAGPTSWRYMFVIGSCRHSYSCTFAAGLMSPQYGLLPTEFGARRRCGLKWAVFHHRTRNSRNSP